MPSFILFSSQGPSLSSRISQSFTCRRRLAPWTPRSRQRFTFRGMPPAPASPSIVVTSLKMKPAVISNFTPRQRRDKDGSLWTSLPVHDGCLRLELTLFCGQAFRWCDCGVVSWDGDSYSEFAGVIENMLVVMRQREEEPAILPDVLYPSAEECLADAVWYRVANTIGNGVDPKAADMRVRNYFHADVDMRAVYSPSVESDERFRRLLPYFRGARTLRQDPVECMFAFICSSNNNVKRITGMVSHLAVAYGELIGTYAGRFFYLFPSVEVLAREALEDDLRKAGFGYRAKFIARASRELLDKGGSDFMYSLRGRAREDVAVELMAFCGVGRKVAGCISLMSLDCSDEIPCDTHIWQIAVRDYIPSLRAKSLTDKKYIQVGDFFRRLHAGGHAGWVNNVLFLGELGHFKARLSKESKPKKDGDAKVSAKRERGFKKEPVNKRCTEANTTSRPPQSSFGDIELVDRVASASEETTVQSVSARDKLVGRRGGKRRRTVVDEPRHDTSIERFGLRQRKSSTSYKGKKVE